MMRLAVISYPKLSQTDSGWLVDIRNKYPKLHYSNLQPHFTFVFPLDIDAEALTQHVRKQAAGQASIAFAIRCALPMPDVSSEDTYVYLVPDEGFSGVLRLHDWLYTGILTAELRLDIAFVPHITLGNTLDAAYCKQVADELNQQPFEICGVIDQLEVVRIEGESRISIAKIALGT